jgi:hypothetical protein
MEILTSPLLGSRVLQQSPLYLVWLIGIIFAFVRWQQHPRISLLTFLTLAGFIILLLLNAIIIILEPNIAAENHWGTEQLLTFYDQMTFLFSLLSAALWGLILWALFRRHKA